MAIATISILPAPTPLPVTGVHFVLSTVRYGAIAALPAPTSLSPLLGFRFAGTQSRILPRRFLNMGGVPIAIQ